MSNLIPLEDAAKLLGLSVDKLNEMRSNSEIFGYKDGASWKFKMQELERVADELDITINVGGAASAAAEEILDIADDEPIEFDLSNDDDEIQLLDDDDDEIQLVDADEPEQNILDFDDDDDIQLLDDDEEEPMLVSEDKDDEIQLLDDDDDDIQLVDDAPVLEVSEDRGIDLADDDDESIELLDLDDEPAEAPVPFAGDDELEIVMDDDDFKLEDDSTDALELAEEDDLVMSSSDVNLMGDEEAKIEKSGESTGFLLEDDDDDDLDVGPGSELQLDGAGEAAALTGASGPGTNDLLGGLDDSGDMLLSEDDLFEDDLQIQESQDDLELSSEFGDSEELIMDDSDSGVDLVAADDSGLMMLEEDSGDLDLSGGLMDLAGADDDDEMIVLDDPAAADAPTDIADDDFNLTPLEEMADDESSGSQVIALEDSDMFSDDTAATLLQPSDEMAAEPMLTEDAMDVGEFGGFDAGMPGMAPGMVTPGTVGALPEQPYTVWQIASLGLVLFLLLVGGMVGYDLARNLWLPEDQIITGGILKMILSLVGG